LGVNKYFHFFFDRVEITITISTEYGVSAFICPKKSASQKQSNLADLTREKD